MKSPFLFLVIICYSIAAKAQSDKQPYLVKSLSAESINSAKINASGGSISVMGVNASEARLEVFVTSNNNENLLMKRNKKQLNNIYLLCY